MITLILAAALASCAGPNHDSNKTTETMTNNNPKDSITSIHKFSIKALDGTTINFADFKGKKILVVNTASECGYTPQYKDLQALYEKYKGKLVIVGFPANDFGGQEPGSNTEIKSFCEKNYGVTFPMTEKVSVKGDGMTPIYQWLTQKTQNGVLDATIKWNFNKFLLDEKGIVIAKFDSGTKPMDEAITGKL